MSHDVSPAVKGPTRFYSDMLEHVRCTLLRDARQGEKLPAERQLAEQFGISSVTMGKVLRDLQDDGWVHRVPGKGTFVNQSIPSSAAEHPAQNGAGRLVHVRAPEAKPNLWIVASFNPIYNGLQAGESRGWLLTSTLERLVQAAGGQTSVTNLQMCPDVETEIEQHENRPLNVVVVLRGSSEMDPAVERFLRRRYFANGGDYLPVILVSFGHEDWPFDQVRASDEVGIIASVQHLVQRGHREITYLAPAVGPRETGFNWVPRRIDYFQRAVALAGMAPGSRVLQGEYPVSGCDDENFERMWRARSEGAVQALLDDPAHRNVTAVIAANDVVARIFRAECERRGRRLPADYALVGFDDTSESSSTGLTTIHFPIQVMADRVMELLSRRLNQPASGEHVEIVVRPTLIARNSTLGFDARTRPVQSECAGDKPK